MFYDSRDVFSQGRGGWAQRSQVQVLPFGLLHSPQPTGWGFCLRAEYITGGFMIRDTVLDDVPRLRR